MADFFDPLLNSNPNPPKQQQKHSPTTPSTQTTEPKSQPPTQKPKQQPKNPLFDDDDEDDLPHPLFQKSQPNPTEPQVFKSPTSKSSTISHPVPPPSFLEDEDEDDELFRPKQPKEKPTEAPKEKPKEKPKDQPKEQKQVVKNPLFDEPDTTPSTQTTEPKSQPPTQKPKQQPTNPLFDDDQEDLPHPLFQKPKPEPQPAPSQAQPKVATPTQPRSSPSVTQKSKPEQVEDEHLPHPLFQKTTVASATPAPTPSSTVTSSPQTKRLSTSQPKTSTPTQERKDPFQQGVSGLDFEAKGVEQDFSIKVSSGLSKEVEDDLFGDNKDSTTSAFEDSSLWNLKKPITLQQHKVFGDNSTDESAVDDLLLIKGDPTTELFGSQEAKPSKPKTSENVNLFADDVSDDLSAFERRPKPKNLPTLAPKTKLPDNLFETAATDAAADIDSFDISAYIAQNKLNEDKGLFD